MSYGMNTIKAVVHESLVRYHLGNHCIWETTVEVGEVGVLLLKMI